MNNSPDNFSSKIVYDFCRYFVAFTIISYGWAKIMGSQFTVLDSELDKPMGQVSGFWLTWYFFGYSQIYGNLIAIFQIICGFLLLNRKTVLLSTSILFGILGNIILVDVFYQIDLGALLMAVFLEILLAVILSFHKDELIQLFWKTQNSVFSTIQNSKKIQLLKVILIGLFVILPPSCTYYIANYNNRFPTEIDGKWKVSNASSPFVSSKPPMTKVYFEHNRAFMTVFRFGNNEWTTHHFETNAQTKEIKIWEKWLLKDTEIFEGKYHLADNKMILEGRQKPADNSVKIEFIKD